jgi:hypothetical protein
MCDTSVRETLQEKTEIIILHASGLSQRWTAEQFHRCQDPDSDPSVEFIGDVRRPEVFRKNQEQVAMQTAAPLFTFASNMRDLNVNICFPSAFTLRQRIYGTRSMHDNSKR